MVKYKKIYAEYMDIGEQDKPLCEYCNSAYIVDIHHCLARSHNGKDEIQNLIGLCRNCHNKAHASKEFNNELKEIVKRRHLHELF